MTGWKDININKLASIFGIATLVLPLVSLTSLIHHTNLIDLYSYLLLSPTPLAPLYLTLTTTYLGQINTVIDVIAYTDPGTKLLLDALYLVPIEVAFVLGSISLICRMLSESPACDTFQDVLDSKASENYKREEDEIYVNIQVLLILILTQFLIYITMPAVNLQLIGISVLLLTVATWTGSNIAKSIQRILESEVTVT